MIGVIFQYINEIVEIRINNNELLFRTQSSFGKFIPIEHIRIDKKGVLKEFPDLIDNPEWRIISIQRLKDKLKSFQTEDEKIKYIIEDLAKYGYRAMYTQKQGHRVVKL